MYPVHLKDLGKHHKMMDEDQYWLLVQHSLQASKSQREQRRYLVSRLANLPLEEIIGFRLRTDKLLYDSYKSNLWCAALLMNNYCFDDCFEYFRNWLISRGKETYYKALSDPDYLINEINEELQFYQFEFFWYVALDAFKIRTDKNLYDHIDYDKFTTHEWNYPRFEFTWKSSEPETMKVICPLLFAKFRN